MFGEGQNHSISKRPLKGPQSEFAHIFLLFVLFFSANIPTGWFVCAFSTTRSVYVWFATSCVSCFEDSCLTWALVCLIASYPLWNWMKPQAKNHMTGLGLMLHVPLGWADAHKTIQRRVVKEENNKIFQENAFQPWSLQYIVVLMSISFHTVKTFSFGRKQWMSSE